jgi:hypothetical protein
MYSSEVSMCICGHNIVQHQLPEDEYECESYCYKCDCSQYEDIEPEDE